MAAPHQVARIIGKGGAALHARYTATVRSPTRQQPVERASPGAGQQHQAFLVLERRRASSGLSRKRANAGSSHSAPIMFQRNIKVSRIPISAWNLIDEKIQKTTPRASVIPVKATALPVVFRVSR